MGEKLETVITIGLDWIEEDPDQPRRAPNQAATAGLAVSLKSPAGMISPVIVRPKRAPDPHQDGRAAIVPDRYVLTAGHRRVLAARLAGWKGVPAIVRDVDTKTARMMQVTENLQREDLNPIEEARGFDSLLQLGWTQEQVALHVNRSQAHISNNIRLLKLPEVLQNAIAAGKITARHGRALFPLLPYPAILELVGKRIVKGDVLAGTDVLEHDAENLERNLPWQISRAAPNHARPLSSWASWGPKNPLGRQGCLFTPGNAVALKSLTPVLQKEATAKDVFYHPGPCTKCPHGLGVRHGEGLCLEPSGECYRIRQANAATVTKARELGVTKRGAGKSGRARELDSKRRRSERWAVAVTKARVLFRRRRARPADIFLRVLYDKATSYPERDWIPRVLAPDLKDAKGLSLVAFRKNPFPHLKSLSVKQLAEILQTVLAVEDASNRRWRSGWPFKPPAIKGLGEW